MKTPENKNGYNTVRLTNINGLSKIFRVHCLVGIVFIDNPHNKKFIDHIDNIRNNNYYKNLRWVSHSENMLNTIRNNIYKQKNDNIIKNININNNENYKNIGLIEDYNFSDYEINEYGNIRKIINKKEIKNYINDGYLSASLFDKNKKIRKNFRIHRLVGYTFVKKPDDYNINYVINHIDNNRLNNHYINLEWCTSKENTRKYFTKRIQQIDPKTNLILNEFKTFTEAYNYINKPYNSHISKCCNNVYNIVHGYKWKLIK